MSSLEVTLDAAMRCLVKDIATTLGQSPAPLINAMKKEKVAPYIFEEAAEKDIDMRCSYITQPPMARRILQTCGQPVLWSAGIHRCPEHLHLEALLSPHLPVVKELEGQEYLYVSEDYRIYNGEFEVVGAYLPYSKSVKLFNIMES